MTTLTGLQVQISDLLRRVGASRPVAVRAPLDGLRVGSSAVAEGAEVEVEVLLERIPEGILARGTVRVPYTSTCRRCSRDLSANLAVSVAELFESDPVAGETYLLERDTLDLEPMARDAILLDLPATPLCREDCRGLCSQCGADRNEVECNCTHDDTDPRWAALRSLPR